MDEKITVPPVTLGAPFNSSISPSTIERGETYESGGGSIGIAPKNGRGWRNGVYVGMDDKGRTNQVSSDKSEMQFGRDTVSRPNPEDSMKTRVFYICVNGSPRRINVYVSGEPYV